MSNSPIGPLSIHVVIPHYRCHHWLDACLTCLHSRASGDFSCTVVSMDDTPSDVQLMASMCEGRANIVQMDAREMVGGQPIPPALTLGTMCGESSDITVTVDPDALVMANRWDEQLRTLFGDENLMVAGINPRSSSSEFSNTPEWNWCAFRTKWWRERVKSFDAYKYDIGHRFKHVADSGGHRVHTWPWLSSPYNGKAAAFTGDAFAKPWVFHAFYSSRRRRDYIPKSELSGILTAEQEEACIKWCLNYREE